VYKALMQSVSHAVVDHEAICKANRSLDLVALKCSKPRKERENFDIQVNYSKTLKAGGADWGVEVHEKFQTSANEECLSMGLLCESIKDLRQQSKVPFTLATLASIGIEMINIVEEMHNKFGLYHSDVHAFNWVVRKSNPGKLSLIDYGYMRPLTTVEERIDELREMIITLRHLVDLDTAFYVAKRVNTNDISEICPRGIIPASLTAIVAHVYGLKAASFDTRNGYSQIRDMFAGIISSEGLTYNGEINWTSKELAPASIPVSIRSVATRNGEISSTIAATIVFAIFAFL
jgi:hypothetical protein